MYTLINARPSPYGRKVAVALIEKGLDFRVQYDVPWSDETCTPDHSPVQQLPILIDATGEAIFDSPYILEWLEVHHPEPALLPKGALERLKVRKRQMLGERLMEFAQALIFEALRAEPSEPWINRQTKKVLGATRALEELYFERDSGEPIDLGDITAATTLATLEFVVPAGLSPDIAALRWREGHPALVALSKSMEARPSFLATTPQQMQVDLRSTIR